MFGELKVVPACLVDGCEQPAFGRAATFCPGHKDWESEECDACGEVKVAADAFGNQAGETIQIGRIHPAAIDPPDYEWICDDCIALREEMEESFAEARAENYGEYPPGYDGTGRF